MSVIESDIELENLIDCQQPLRLDRLAIEDTIWEWDLTTDLVNPCARAAKSGHTDWQSDSPITWWENHIHPEDREATIAVFADAVHSKEMGVSVEYRFCKADGNIAYIYDRAFIIRDKAGVATRMIGAMIDLTELRLVNLLLRKTENRLAYSSRLNAMGTMGSMVAHELSQPLTAAANYIRASRDIFASGKSDDFDKIHDALEGAERNTLRAGDIIRKLRDVVNNHGIVGADNSLAQLIDDGCSMGLNDAKSRTVLVRKTINPTDLTVWVDGIQVQQVIINLVRNAAEAMANSANPEIIVDAQKVGSFAQISISDNGTGIANDVRDGIFSAVVTTKATGMGIGLSISRTIIDAQGGEIWLESSTPGLTDFRFTLPLSQIDETGESSDTT